MVPVGATLTRIYFAVRTASDYGAFRQYDNWDDVVIAAQAKHAEYTASFTASLGGLREDIKTLADKAVCVETRWVMAWGRDADGIGGSEDFMHERHADVTVLRTRASFTPTSR